MKPLAFVIPWFGENLTGGAEQQAFQIATRLARRGHSVEVLTTCNRSFESDWGINHFKSGVTEEFGLTIRRFAVEARAADLFDQVNAKLLAVARQPRQRGVSPVPSVDTDIFVNENIKSNALLDFLRGHKTAYHAIVFIPYMFGPITNGIPIVADSAWLQPCLHDEPQAYFPQIAALFRMAKGLLLNSPGELELSLKLYGPGIFTRSIVVGEGIEHSDYPGQQLRAALPSQLLDTRYLLYLGRREPVKNVHLLVNAFTRFKELHPNSELRLVLAGTGSESFAEHDFITELGFVSDGLKAALLKNCLALVQPSENESFSRVLMEAWAMGRPAAVNGKCLATATAVNDAKGGWTPISVEDWTNLFEYLDSASPDILDDFGRNGREYSDTNADWDKVITRYESVLGLKGTAGQVNKTLHSRSLPAIHQVLPDFVSGDAISNQARALRTQFHQHGYSSNIYCKRRDERLTEEALLLAESNPEPGSALIYHYGIGSDVTSAVLSHEGPRALVYHNITPASYFVPYRPGFAWMLEVGRQGLKRLGSNFTVSVADSAYNAAELVSCGFRDPQVLPIIIDPDRWNIEPDVELLARLQDGKTNILFTGRVAPNKKQDRLLRAFRSYRELDSNSRLIMVGENMSFDPYAQYVIELTRELGLRDCVELVGQIDDSQLLAYYQTAHLYWSASEHEGFGAPLIEAMWFDIPVMALDESAVGETISNAGLLYDRDEPLDQVARRAYEVIHNEAQRREVITKQRLRRLKFLPEAVAPKITRLCESLERSLAERSTSSELADSSVTVQH